MAPFLCVQDFTRDTFETISWRTGNQWELGELQKLLLQDTGGAPKEWMRINQEECWML